MAIILKYFSDNWSITKNKLLKGNNEIISWRVDNQLVECGSEGG